MRKDWFPIATALLGVVIGAMAVLLAVRVTDKAGTVKLGDGNWNKLNIVLQTLEKNYVDTVDCESVTKAALTAALSSLDPHSYYMPPVELKASEDDLAANFDGIGIQFNVPNDTAVVIEVISGGPSEKVGLMKGDKILKVDTTVIAGVRCPQDDMVKLMRGTSGTKVLVTVARGQEIIPFEIVRGKIPLYSVDCSFMIDDTLAYIRLSKFSRTTAAEVQLSCENLRASGMKSLIFDLRENTGGYFDQALSLANQFLPKNAPIVYLEGVHRPRENYKADGRGDFKDISLAVLIDENSASSSEIFAGAMQDNHRAVVVGRRSFGKGLVQEPLYFTDGSGVRFTVARFHTPSGRCIQKPYSDDYQYEVYKRYNEGEMVVADSMKIEKGGIIPDVFVPIDTTKAGQFYIQCSKKATVMRFAASFFDSHKEQLSSIGDYRELIAFLDSAGLDRRFLEFASDVDGLRPAPGEWADEKPYMLSQIRALVGRYSKLGDDAYYHLFMPVDATIKAAVKALGAESSM